MKGMNLVTIIIALISSLIGGLISPLVLKILDYKISDYKEKKLSRSELKKEIVKLCSEGKQSSWEYPPRSREHTIYITDLALLEDSELGKFLEGYCFCWEVATRLHQNDAKYVNELGIDQQTQNKLEQKMRTIAQENRERILKKLKTWK